jgi:3,4-dihydroxy 2-butanone 4-phosphate synthase / GTP cyclohydrolase II
MFNTVEMAIESIKQGKFVIVTDDESRENEGDLIIASEKITEEAISFMAKKASGLICLAITQEKANQLNLPLQQHGDHQPPCQTAFTYSIDARFGISTGISSQDRVRSINVVMNDNACPEDIVIPGHIFPLIAKKQGVLERPGHTEAAVDLARLAGLKPSGVICEIMDDDGSMLRGEKLMQFATLHEIPILSIASLIEYRQQHSLTTPPYDAPLIHIAASTQLQTKFGEFLMLTFFNHSDHREHVALIHGDLNQQTAAKLRIHSECLTGDTFGSLQCDCGQQLEESLQMLAQSQLGILIYLRQEGRDIGLTNKLRAYALQSKGYDTVDANLALGLPIDNRNFMPVIDFLNHFNIRHVALLTNNPEKMNALSEKGIQVTREALMTQENNHNACYLKTKKEKMAHLFETKKTKL